MSSGTSQCVLGLSGPVCSGKNLAADFLREDDFYCIDVDLLGHQALINPEIREQVISFFGDEIVSAGNSTREIDRKILGNMVFADLKMLSQLEAIVHPWMRKQVGEMIMVQSHKKICINAAVLFKMELHLFCDAVLWVEAPVFTRLSRLRKRNNLSLLESLKRILSQRALKSKISSYGTDIYYIRNAGSREDFKQKIHSVISRIN